MIIYNIAADILANISGKYIGKIGVFYGWV